MRRSRRIVRRSRQPGVVAHTNLGIALTGQGKLEDAIAEFARPSAPSPRPQGSRQPRKGLGKSTTRDEAIVEYRAAIRLDPRDAESPTDLAGAEEQGGLAAAGSTARPSGLSPTMRQATTTLALPCGEGGADRGDRRIPRGPRPDATGLRPRPAD